MNAYTISDTVTSDGGSVILSDGGAISTTLAAASGTSSYTLDMPTSPGAATSIFKTNGTTAASFKILKPLMWLVRATRGSGQGAGALAEGAWRTTPNLNNVMSTPGHNGEVSLNSGAQQISIVEGSYYIWVTVPIRIGIAATTAQCRLANITLGTFTYGTTTYSANTTATLTFVADIVTVPPGQTYVFEIQARSSQSASFGAAISGAGSVTEQMKILKLSD